MCAMLKTSSWILVRALPGYMRVRVCMPVCVCACLCVCARLRLFV